MKVPPPLQAIIAAVLMYFIAKYDGQFNELLKMFAIAIACLGLAVAGAGIWQFKRHKTTTSPIKIDKVSSLVTTGIYAYTRNPMYVGIVFVLIAWALWLGSALAFFVLPLFMLSMTYLQIKKEEQTLQTLFGDDYTEYYYKTRRWL